MEEELVLPPPITRTVQALDVADPTIPGEIKLDESGRLLKTYLEYSGFAAPIIEGYNQWLVQLLPKQLAAFTLDQPTGTIRFERPMVDSPKILGRNEPLYPMKARNDGLTYSGALYTDLVRTPKTTLTVTPGLPRVNPLTEREEKEDRQGPVFAGFIPIMLSSQPCHLQGKSDTERLQLGECSKDPFGYFIIKGAERVIITQEQLRKNRFFVYSPDSKGKTVIARMTCSTIKGDSIVTLYRFDKDNVIRLGLRFMGRSQGTKPNTISVFQAYRLLGVQGTETLLQHISRFTRPEWVQKVWYTLQPSLQQLSRVANDIEDISRMKGILNLPYETRRATILQDLTDELFPQMVGEPIERKLDMLGMMTVRLAEYMAGLRGLDDRDSWSNKRLETAGRSIAKLFMGLWTKVINEIQDDINRTRTDTLDGVVRLFQTRARIITEEFVSSFSSNNWGVRGSRQKENITDNLKRDSVLSVYSHMMRINAPASRKAKMPSLRLVHMTSLGYICPSETPEGENCGLTKNFASTAFVSIEREELPVWDRLREYVVSIPTPEKRTQLMLNGKFKGWCAGETLRALLVAWRRGGLIWRDAEVVLPQYKQRGTLWTESTLYVNFDGGLPMRPLLIVEEGELVLHRKRREWQAEIDELKRTGQTQAAEVKRAWTQKWDTLLTEGCVEYVGAFEQEYIMLAQSINDLQARQADIKNVQAQLNDAKAELARATPQKLAGAQEQVQLAENALAAATQRRPYTHCELDPAAILGVAASIIPMPERQPGPRSTYQCSMGKQSLGIYHSNYMNRFDSAVKTLAFPTRPLFEPQMNALIGLNELPAGRTITVLIATYLGFNQEDAFIVNKRSIDLGLFWYMKWSIFKTVVKSTRDYTEQLGRPELRKGEDPQRYALLDDRGIAKPGSKYRQGQCLIGKVRINRMTGEVSNASVYAGVSEDGIVDQILVSTNAENYTVVKVKTVTPRKPVVGDKLACFTPDHEILTWERGWISITDMKMDEHIATLVNGNQLVYDTPTELQQYDYEGPLHVVKSNQVSLAVTPNHRMYIKTRSRNDYTIMRADEIVDKHVHYKKDAEWLTPEREHFELPEYTCMFRQKEKTFPAKLLGMDDWLTFLGIWMAEGCADLERTTICINKPRVQAVIFDVIKRLGYNPTPSGDKVYVTNKQLDHYMTQLSVGAINKRLPNWVWALNQRQSRVLLDAMILGDGCMNNKTPIYSTSSTGLKDDVMRLALHCGWAANAYVKVPAGTTGVIKGVPYITHADNWSVTIVKTQVNPAVNKHIKGQQTIENYKGKVYCCSVPSGVIYVRRRVGDTVLPVWCGQSRYSQKGTIGLILDEADMPFNKDGVSPDLIINPHAIPSRMTMGKLIEIVASKLAALNGERVNATAFRNFDIDEMRRQLKQYGYNEWGNETFTSGVTGKPIQGQLFSGPCYYQMLRHHVKDKKQARGVGLVKPMSRQPVGGRSTEGGSALRIGEMERDAFISHGAAATLQERLCLVSDKYKTVFCTNCGTIAISDQVQKLYSCRKCGQQGRFANVTIPYAYKLLVHYLAGAGLHMPLRLTTQE